MNRFLYAILFLASVASAADFLLDDFDDEDDRNEIGTYWYYYSDANDSGTTAIHNTSGHDGSAYSVVTPVPKQEGETDYCALVDFTPGDSLGWDLQGFWRPSEAADFVPFAGIGTDITTDHTVPIDMFSFDSISFDMYASETLAVIIEFVKNDFSSDCNYAHYQKRMLCPDTWQHVSLTRDQFEQPIWVTASCEICDTSYFESIIKINWKLTGRDCSDAQCPHGERYQFYLDNVTFHGVDEIESFHTGLRHHRDTEKPLVKYRPEISNAVFDLLGRSESPAIQKKHQGVRVIRRPTGRTSLYLSIH